MPSDTSQAESCVSPPRALVQTKGEPLSHWIARAVPCSWKSCSRTPRTSAPRAPGKSVTASTKRLCASRTVHGSHCDPFPAPNHLCPVCRETPNSSQSAERLLPFCAARSTNCSFKLMARCSFQGIHLLNTVNDVLTLLCQRCPGTAPPYGPVQAPMYPDATEL